MKSLFAPVFFFAAVVSEAAEFRTWTSLNGATVEAQFLKLDGAKVYLTTKKPAEINLKTSELSLADRQYLVEFADADKDLVFKGDITIPEKALRLPNDFLKEMEEDLLIPGEDGLSLNLFETEHFIFATDNKLRLKGVAETAEACWHGMSFQHMEFRENWGDKKMLIVIPETDETHMKLGRYQFERMKKAGQQEQLVNLEITWGRTGSTVMAAPEDAVDSLGIMPSALLIRNSEASSVKKALEPFHVHVISTRLYSFQLGGSSQVSAKGRFALMKGHAYYKEIQLCKRTASSLLSASDEGDISSKAGFEDGRSWARTLRSLVKRGKVTPNLQEMLELDLEQLNPQRLVLMYSFSSYMQSTPKRIAAYARLTRQINTSRQIPDTSEMARFFGFESTEKFEEDWVNYIKSNEFR